MLSIRSTAAATHPHPPRPPRLSAHDAPARTRRGPAAGLRGRARARAHAELKLARRPKLAKPGRASGAQLLASTRRTPSTRHLVPRASLTSRYRSRARHCGASASPARACAARRAACIPHWRAVHGTARTRRTARRPAPPHPCTPAPPAAWNTAHAAQCRDTRCRSPRRSSRRPGQSVSASPWSALRRRDGPRVGVSVTPDLTICRRSRSARRMAYCTACGAPGVWRRLGGGGRLAAAGDLAGGPRRMSAAPPRARGECTDISGAAESGSRGTAFGNSGCWNWEARRSRC